MIDPLDLPRPLAFVLGGGGSFGAMQVGMLRALEERGIAPDLVVGTSIGALNGAIIAADPTTALANLTRIWDDLDPADILGRGLFRRMLAVARRKNHLYSNDGLRAIIAEHSTADNIEELVLPFGAVALDIDTVSSHLFLSGPLVDSVLASAAIPGIFPPVVVDGRSYYDGGVTANVPVLQALEMGAKSVIVLDCIFADQRTSAPSTLVRALFFASLVATRAQVARELPIAAAQVPVVYLPGPKPLYLSPLDFRSSPALIEEAYEAAANFLDSASIAGSGFYRQPAELVVPTIPRRPVRTRTGRISRFRRRWRGWRGWRQPPSEGV